MKGRISIWLWIWLGIVGGLFLILLMVIPGVDSISTGPKIGLVEITGPIYSSRQAVKDLNYFKNRSDIEAIVIRLETPGGGVAASQEIYEKVKSMSGGKVPILASMGGVAASGGYYIAMGADTIMANPGTATGSIGVIMGYPTVNELMEKVGIKYETYKSGVLKDSGSTFRDANEDDKRYFQELIDNLHGQFVRAVSSSRDLTIEKTRELANGQVYSGEQAVQLGLVDLLGTFDNCLDLAAKLAGFDDIPQVIHPPREEIGFFKYLLSESKKQFPEFRTYPVPEFRIH